MDRCSDELYEKGTYIVISSTRLCDDVDEDMAVVARPTPTSSKSGEASTTHNRCGDRSDPIPLCQSLPRASTARLGGDESGYGRM